MDESAATILDQPSAEKPVAPVARVYPPWTWMEVLVVIGILYAFLFIFGLVCYLFYRRWRNKPFVEDWSNKAVLVTGCDRGFGHELVLELDRLGAYVYAGCHSEIGIGRLRPLVSNRVHLLEIDVADTKSIQKCKDFVEHDLPEGVEFWALVNNAGMARGMVFDFADEKDYREVFDVNFFGVISVTEAFLPLIKKYRGRIVNVGSMMGRCALTSGPYSSSKFALESYSNGLRLCLKAFGVHVAIIEPGFFKTGLTNPSHWNNEIDRLWDKMPENLKDDFGEDYKYKIKDAFLRFMESPPCTTFNSLDMVVEDMIHAIAALRPKDRYVNGFDGHFIYRPVSILPDGVLDYIVWNNFLPYTDLLRKRIRSSYK